MGRYFCLFFALLLTACNLLTTSQPNCDQIAGLTLRGFLFKEINPEQLQSSIAEKFNLRNEMISAQPVGADWLLDWNKGGVFYSMSTEGKVTSRAYVVYEQGAPSADQLIQCLGTPSRYWAYYTRSVPGHELDLYLLFPNQGILGEGAKYGDYNAIQPPPLDGNILLGSLSYVKPGSDEEVLRRVLSPQLVDVEKAVREDFKPWPGAWKDIVIEIDPTLRSK
jgi:hypothetical protein